MPMALMVSTSPSGIMDVAAPTPLHVHDIPAHSAGREEGVAERDVDVYNSTATGGAS